MLMSYSFIETCTSLANTPCARQNPTERQGYHSRYYMRHIVRLGLSGLQGMNNGNDDLPVAHGTYLYADHEHQELQALGLNLFVAFDTFNLRDEVTRGSSPSHNRNNF